MMKSYKVSSFRNKKKAVSHGGQNKLPSDVQGLKGRH